VVAALAGGIVFAGSGTAAWLWTSRRHRDPAPAALTWYRDGLTALHNGSYHRASKLLARAVEIDPSYAMAHAYLAEAWYELDYLERAMSELLKAMAAVDSLPAVDKLHLDAIRPTVVGEFKTAVAKYREISRTVAVRRTRRRAARTGPRRGTQPGYEAGHGCLFGSDSPRRAERRRLAPPGCA
jgi:tetratricopeptide (TPR) repeat protein